jgi:putative hemolysin
VTTILIVFLVFCIGILALFSGAETALFSLSSMQVKAFKKDHDPRKKQIAKLLENPRELLVSLIIIIIVMSLLIQSVISTLFAERSSWTLNVIVPLAVNLILGEVIPKSLAMPNNAKVAYKTAPLLSKIQVVLFPIRKMLSWVTSFVIPVFFFFLQKEKDISIDELQHALKESKDRGVLLPEESELIRGYLHLQESTVKDVMRPREEVICFESSEPLSRLLHLFIDQECTRIPFCHGGLDHLEGVITSQIFFLHKGKIKETKDLIPVLKPPYFVPETLKADALLRQLYEKKESFAFVVNEYGSVTGIISMEDLVEEVIGEIVDRRDREAFFTRAGKHEIIASGKLEISQFEEIFGVHLESETHRVTVGGWIIEQIGDIPKPGVKYRTKEFLFHILSADHTRIRRVYIRRLSGSKLKK